MPKFRNSEVVEAFQFVLVKDEEAVSTGGMTPLHWGPVCRDPGNGSPTYYIRQEDESLLYVGDGEWVVLGASEVNAYITMTQEDFDDKYEPVVENPHLQPALGTATTERRIQRIEAMTHYAPHNYKGEEIPGEKCWLCRALAAFVESEVEAALRGNNCGVTDANE